MQKSFQCQFIGPVQTWNSRKKKSKCLVEAGGRKKITFSLANYIKENPEVPKNHVLSFLRPVFLNLWFQSFSPLMARGCACGMPYRQVSPRRVESHPFLASTPLRWGHSTWFLTCRFLTAKQMNYFLAMTISPLRSQGNYRYMWLLKSLGAGLCLRLFCGWLIYTEWFFVCVYFFFKDLNVFHYRLLFLLHIFVFPLGFNV